MGEKIWQGEFVSNLLRVGIENKPQIIDIQDLVGLSLRRNPKRAHLLVSKVLGKHIPVSPGLVIAAGQLLGAKAYNALGGHVADLDAVSGLVKQRLGGTKIDIPSFDIPSAIPAIVVGYAETATSLGNIVAEYLHAPYIHSTRYGNPNRVPYGRFEESHSHATSHKLLPDDAGFFNNDLPMVLVDDEISTGKTIRATIVSMHILNPRKKYVVVSLIDCRNEDDKQEMEDLAKLINAEITVVSLSEGVVTYPVDAVELAGRIIDAIDALPKVSQEYLTRIWQTHTIKADFSPFQHARYGIDKFDHRLAEDIAAKVAEKAAGKTLVLGTEEFMYLPLAVAGVLEKGGMDVYSSSTTQSPVATYDQWSYAIRTSLTYLGPDDEKRFAYNITGFDTIVVIVEPGTGSEEITKMAGLAQNLATVTKNIIIVEGE